MGSHLYYLAHVYSRARGHAYALIQTIAGDIPGDEDEGDRRYSTTDERLMAKARLAPKQFETARIQLERMGELAYWPDAKQAGHTVYQILEFPGER